MFYSVVWQLSMSFLFYLMSYWLDVLGFWSLFTNLWFGHCFLWSFRFLLMGSWLYHFCSSRFYDFCLFTMGFVFTIALYWNRLVRVVFSYLDCCGAALLSIKLTYCLSTFLVFAFMKHLHSVYPSLVIISCLRVFFTTVRGWLVGSL